MLVCRSIIFGDTMGGIHNPFMGFLRWRNAHLPPLVFVRGISFFQNLHSWVPWSFLDLFYGGFFDKILSTWVQNHHEKPAFKVICWKKYVVPSILGSKSMSRVKGVSNVSFFTEGWPSKAARLSCLEDITRIDHVLDFWFPDVTTAPAFVRWKFILHFETWQKKKNPLTLKKKRLGLTNPWITGWIPE